MRASPCERPVIGLTLDFEEGGGYAQLPWYALRANYCEAVVAAGGNPILLPHELACAEDYLELLDGLIVTGGAFDIDPALYGERARHPTVRLKDRRTRFEWALLERALALDLPILGICGGQQLLNVVLGGRLIQHIPEAFPDALAHEQPNPRTEPGHEVLVRPGTLLHRLTGSERLWVNSAHHQAAETVGPAVVVSAVAPDGIIEAIEDPRRSFCLGVQWHPEYHITPADGAILAGLVEAARLRRTRRRRAWASAAR